VSIAAAAGFLFLPGPERWLAFGVFVAAGLDIAWISRPATAGATA
jgi:hypothetical protein